jgi:hypothetical protein
MEEAKITVTGCLKQGASAGSLVLEAARPTAAGASGQPSTGAVGTTGTNAPAMAKSYSLVTKAADELSKHVNHRIEVIGSVSPRRADASQGASAQPGSAAAASAQPSETLTVQSFKMVAATCS